MTSTAHGHRANKVWYRILASGKIRVVVTYTVPELREAREIYVEFNSHKKAKDFYWQMVRGAEFYPPEPGQTTYVQPPAKPSPW